MNAVLHLGLVALALAGSTVRTADADAAEAIAAGDVPDFPAHLRRPRPVADIREAAVFSINEFTRSGGDVDRARKVGSDVLIRAWFKWAQAPPVAEYRSIPQEVHALGALLGGGITCSALYDGENGILRDELLDMATRNPAGDLVDAWGQKGIRHGSLSSPRYLDYLFRWCREQIDAGVDLLFLDEHTAALGAEEGYDDHSLRDFREYLLAACPRTRGWRPGDARWGTELGVDSRDARVCPSGDMTSFDYRGHLRAKGFLARPSAPENRLHPLWEEFRSFRDDRSWKALTDRIRAYARERGRTVFLSANGIARYVDLQVLGVWGAWTTRDGRIDLDEGKVGYWRSIVARGHEAAGKPVPVVLFHDWGMGTPPFPWLAVSPSEREIWMRTRGAEIYAAGGFFAFPVLGPFGCDAGKDGTIREMARLTAYYQAHRDLYVRSRFLASEPLSSEVARLSLAAAWSEARSALLVHVINREIREPIDGEAQRERRLAPRGEVSVRVPVAAVPRRVTVVSPDWEGERPGGARLQARGDAHGDAHEDGQELVVSIPGLEAYAVAILEYPEPPDLSRLKDPARVVLSSFWSRAPRSEFRLRPDGIPENACDLNGYLQGKLHTHLRNSPTFLVSAPEGGELLVRVRAVAREGARVDLLVDGEPRASVDLPDLDGKNDADALEYDRVLSFPIPAGRHRITLDNTGADWAALSWIEFRGKFAEW